MPTTTIAISSNDPVYDPVSAELAGATVWAIVERGRVQWVGVDSIRRTLPGIDNYSSWQRFVSKQKTMKCRTKNGAIVEGQFINKEDYINAASGHPMSEALRNAMAAICAKLDDDGMVVDAQFADDPLVQLATTGLRTALRVAEISKKLDTLEAGQKSIARRADSAYNLAETSLELQVTRNGRLRAIPELSRRGWKIDEANFGNVGGELTRISLRIGDDPRAPENQCQWRNDLVHTYIEQAFTLWEKECGPKYPRRSGTISTGLA